MALTIDRLIMAATAWQLVGLFSKYLLPLQEADGEGPVSELIEELWAEGSWYNNLFYEYAEELGQLMNMEQAFSLGYFTTKEGYPSPVWVSGR